MPTLPGAAEVGAEDGEGEVHVADAIHQTDAFRRRLEEERLKRTNPPIACLDDAGVISSTEHYAHANITAPVTMSAPPQ